MNAGFAEKALEIDMAGDGTSTVFSLGIAESGARAAAWQRVDSEITTNME